MVSVHVKFKFIMMTAEATNSFFKSKIALFCETILKEKL